MIVRPLTEYCTLNMGQSPDSKTYNTQGNGLPFYQGNADFGETHPITRVWCSAPVKVAEDGDILISVRAPIGAMNMAVERCCIGRGLAALTPIRNKCSKLFLYYALQSKVDSLIAQGTGSTFKAISKKVLEATCIPAYSTIEQVQIAEIIGRVDNTIAARRNQLVLLDQLVKSRFIELFGNFVYEHGRWSICEIGDVADTIDPQPSHRTPPVSSDGVPYIGIAECNYKTPQIDFANARKVGRDVLQEHLNRYTLNKGDFIIGKIGTIGKPFFLPAEQTYTLSANTVLIKPNKQKVEPQFLFAVFQSEYMERIIDAEKKSTSQPAFGIQKVRKIDIPMPPLELQEQFAAFVKQTDKSKLAVQKGLQELEILKKSLMQQYFG